MRWIRAEWLVLLALAACAAGPRPVETYDSAEKNHAEAQRAGRRAEWERVGPLLDAAFARGWTPSPWDLVLRAGAFEGTHDWAGGEAWIRTYALARFPGFTPLLEHRAACLDHLPGRRAEAEEVARVALREDPTRCLAGYVLDHSAERLRTCQASGRHALVSQWAR